MLSRITLLSIAALTGAVFLTSAPAEARRHAAPQRISYGPTIDVAAIPAYPVDGHKAPLARSRAVRRAPAVRLAALTTGDEALAYGRPSPAEGRPSRHGYLWMPTAAGIEIEVAPRFAIAAKAVIDDLVETTGYRPPKLSGLNFGRGHVAGSLHFRARAIDVDQCGWGCTSAPKQALRMIVAKHGLRDGCEFSDAGHFDDGPHLPFKTVLRRCGRAYAEAIWPSLRKQVAAGTEPPAPFYAATAAFKERQAAVHRHRVRIARR